MSTNYPQNIIRHEQKRVSASTREDHIVPPQQLTPSAGVGLVVLQCTEAVGSQEAVTLFPQSVVVCGVPLWQLADVAPCHQRVLEHCVPLFVPEENLAPLLTGDLQTKEVQ